MGYCETCNGYGLLPAQPPKPKLKSEPDKDQVFAFQIEAGEYRTSHLKLEELFGKLSGAIRVCDPFYGAGSLARLDLLAHCSPIQFLTVKKGGGEAVTLPQLINEWNKENPSAEFRIDKSESIHDRYILTANEIVFLGHGIKDPGNKQSFVILIPKKFASDMIESVRESFDQIWNDSKPFED